MTKGIKSIQLVEKDLYGLNGQAWADSGSLELPHPPFLNIQ